MSQSPQAERHADFTGVVLAGGSSSRMGEDKAFVSIDGRFLVERCVDALVTAGAGVVAVVGGDRQRLKAVGLDVWEDGYPGEGPLGAIITALSNAPEGLVVVLACDHTDPQPDTIRAMLGQVDHTTDVVIPLVAQRLQILHSVWRTSSLPTLQSAYIAGERAPRRALNRLHVKEWTPASSTGFHSANTPSELQQRPRATE